ncbi:MAG: L-seryl-tRNA(Sec) selenium transferase [Thermoanaerobaculia bacterium]
MVTESSDIRRQLPSIDRLLADPRIESLVALYGRELVRRQVRRGIDTLRRRLADDPATSEEGLKKLVDELIQKVAAELRTGVGSKLSRVLNATGIFLHTNLGRAPLPRGVAGRLPALLDAYCDLELDLDSGRRSERNRRAELLLTTLTGAEAALVANNNAGALVLVLATLARDREVVVSRGELVEIGGSFRVPDILRAAGARLVEVGTTNRTRIEDYEQAIGPETALLLKVHPSNYRISGFVASAEAAGLVTLARGHGLPLAIDEGSGLLRPHPAPQLQGDESVQELIALGADLVCSSGDKLLGGPQAGLLVGSKELIQRCHRHPLYRALRPDRAAYACLEAVLRCHLAEGPLPLNRLWVEGAVHRSRLEGLAPTFGAEIVEAEAFVGGGAAPERPISGEALALPGDSDLLYRLRLGDPPVVGYIREGRLILDLRTVDPDDDALLATAVTAALAG